MKKEDNIIEAATNLFIEKGYHHVTVRDIAKEAGVNLAMINYYFKNKDNLTRIVINKILSEFHQVLSPIINSKELNIEEKLNQYVSTFIEMLIDKPGLVLSLLAMLKDTKELVYKADLLKYLFDHKQFSEALLKEQSEKRKQKINPEHFYISMLSLILFPYSIIEVITDKKDYTDIGTKRFIRSRKEMAIEMLLAYLKS